MNRAQALTDLLAKVEAGADDPGLRFGFWEGVLSADEWGLVCRIMEPGCDLNAALALHNSVPPGWEVTHLGQTETGWLVALARLGPPTRFEGIHPDNPARAWLCAILKALTAEAGQ